MDLNVLYRREKDLILFHFNCDDDVNDVAGLIDFHFCDRHDFDERVSTGAKSVFKDFYDGYSGDAEYISGPELIDYEEILNK